MNNVAFSKTRANLRNTDKQIKSLFKTDIFSLFKTKLHSTKILGNDLVAIHKIKTT